VVDEDAGQLVSDRPLHQRGGDGRVDAAGQRTQTRPSPTWARTASMSDSAMLAGVQSAAMPAIS
jgi:hypothetical protein